MSAVLDQLLGGLDRDVQRQIRSRIEAMQRHLAFMAASDNRDYYQLIQAGWSSTRLEILCELNSFYQIILGPLASSARGTFEDDLGNEVPIAYGDALVFDRLRARSIRRAMADFMRRTRKLGIPQRVLTAPRADDLVRALTAAVSDQAGDAIDDDLPF